MFPVGLGFRGWGFGWETCRRRADWSDQFILDRAQRLGRNGRLLMKIHSHSNIDGSGLGNYGPCIPLGIPLKGSDNFLATTPPHNKKGFDVQCFGSSLLGEFRPFG